MGGSDGGSHLKSVEMYDPSAGWLCTDGNVHVVGGGSDAATQLASMECFDPIASEWRTLPSMSDARWYCAAVACEM